MGLKPPGNYVDQFRSNKTCVLFLEKPETHNSMISRFSDPPWKPLLIVFKAPGYFKNNEQIFGNMVSAILSSQKMMSRKSVYRTSGILETLWLLKCWNFEMLELLKLSLQNSRVLKLSHIATSTQLHGHRASQLHSHKGGGV